jgi:glycine cleavage system T protein (aminomethyltransferase)
VNATSAADTGVERETLRRTPLYDLHCENGAKMVPFAGYEMPLHYRLGVLKEHLHTRAAAGLFDVSHMGQIAVTTKSGTARHMAIALERLVPADIVELAPGRQRYTLLTNAAAGILDDIIVANLRTHFVVIANAANKETDAAHLRANLPGNIGVELYADRALIALQGPAAEQALAAHAPAIGAMRFMDVQPATIGGIDCVVSRSGYTGEDGFEISVRSERAEALVRMLLRDQNVALVGLGARDSLRLEAGLCLYGCDIDASTSPVEAALEWSIPKSRRRGGSRAGGFIGADIVLAQLAEKPLRRRVALRPQGRAPIRGGARIYSDETSTTPIGQITSGGYGPTVMAPIAMGYVEGAASQPGTRLFAELRGTRHAALVATLPFVPHRYRRG